MKSARWSQESEGRRFGVMETVFEKIFFLFFGQCHLVFFQFKGGSQSGKPSKL